MAILKSKGCVLKAGSTAIAQVISISGPSRSAETADVTELGDSTRSFVATINDNGEVSCVIHYDPDAATHQTLQGLFASQLTTTPSWVLQFTDSTPTTYSFDGPLTGFNVESMEVGGVVTATITIKVSGAITIA